MQDACSMFLITSLSFSNIAYSIIPINTNILCSSKMLTKIQLWIVNTNDKGERSKSAAMQRLEKENKRDMH